MKTNNETLINHESFLFVKNIIACLLKVDTLN